MRQHKAGEGDSLVLVAAIHFVPPTGTGEAKAKWSPCTTECSITIPLPWCYEVTVVGYGNTLLTDLIVQQDIKL